MLCEAIDTYFQDPARMGVPEATDEDTKQEHSFQHLHEQINELFATKTSSFTHYDGVNAAFRSVHNYKYITDPTFKVAMEREMQAQAIPLAEQHKAFEIIPKIISEVSKDSNWSEQDAGFHPDLDEIMKKSRTIGTED